MSFKVGDLVRAIGDYYIDENEVDEWVGQVTAVYSDGTFDAQTVTTTDHCVEMYINLLPECFTFAEHQPNPNKNKIIISLDKDKNELKTILILDGKKVKTGITDCYYEPGEKEYFLDEAIAALKLMRAFI